MDFNLLVIGGGMAGIGAAKAAADLGATVALAEHEKLGGTWLNRGCIPKKALVRAAQLFNLAQKMGEFGIQVQIQGIDWATAVVRKDRLVNSYLTKKGEALEERNIVWIREPVRFLDAHTLQADSRRVTARKVVVATGSKPNRPPIPGIEHTIDSAEILGLKDIPRRLVVIGGGVIAMEFASVFGHVGSQVTVLEALPAILQGTDDDVRKAVEHAASGWNVTIHTGVKVTSIARSDGAASVTADVGGQSRRFDADVVLLATGRGPRIDGLDIDKIGAHF